MNIITTRLATILKYSAVTLLVVTGIGVASLISFTHRFLIADLGEADNLVMSEPLPVPFPLGVNPATQTITQAENVESFLTTQLADSARRERRLGWLGHLERILVRSAAVQQLASGSSRTMVIWPGDRKEQVVDHFGDILRWDDAERAQFAQLAGSTAPAIADGMFMPGKYTLPKDTDPTTAATAVSDRFSEQVLERYPATTQAVLPLEDALVVASLLEREAYSFSDMREISGVVWNRLFIGMPLQLDATLQYAKGTKPSTPVWWPPVRPQDKFIDSPFNTYQNEGLPPQPIANPSAAAILAAMNPNETDCLFYFHHDDGELYCSVTYDEHVEKLRSLYGRGS